jgi:transposase
LAALLEAALARVTDLERQVVDLQQQVRQLTARLEQDSSNSHKPPSSDPPWRELPARKPSGRKAGGQPGHVGHGRKRLPPQRIDRYVHHVPKVCRHCHALLPIEASLKDPEPAWHQVAELPRIAAFITEHQGHARTCPCCGKITRAAIPTSVRAHVLGPRLSAVMSYLAGRCHDGRRTVREVVQDLFGVPLSLGSVCNYETEMSDALAEAHADALHRVRRSAVRYVDETGWSKAGKRCWLWTAATQALACFAVHAERNWQALCDLLGQHAGQGIIHSDRWHAYSPRAARKRQICWAHLKRDFQKWFDRGGPSTLLGQDGLELCRNVFALWRDFRQRNITRRQLQRRSGPLRHRLRQILNWNLSCNDRKASKFCRNLLACEPALWTFSRHPGVEPTNNAAERALRPAVLWRKNSFGCHSQTGLRFAERILTAIHTLRLQKRPVLAWLHETLAAHRKQLPTPLLQ